MTECNQEVFSFAAHFSGRMESSFTAGQVSSDGGALLLRQTDRKIYLLDRVAACFTDQGSPLFVQHQLGEMLSQRIYGLALGYEDVCDHEQLRHDPRMAVLSGKRKLAEPLAGKSTLNRLELPDGSKPTTRSTTLRRRSTRCSLTCSSRRTRRRQTRSCSIWMPPISRSTAISRNGLFMVTTTVTATCRYVS